MPTVTKGTNSYVSEAEATAYFDIRVHATAWTGATAENRQKALLSACQMLDNRIVWYGSKTDDTQPLAWPRIGVPGVAMDAVPSSVGIAQMELSLILLTTDTTAMPQAPEVKSLTLDAIRTEFFQGEDRVRPIPLHIYQLVAAYGGLASGLGTVSLRR